jgi:dihydrofolate synthase/folylpolyglutamate synthase
LHPRNIELGLDRVREVWRRHRDGPLPFPVISVAGTNGKGSVAAMLESIYLAAGYRTACYTSPHLVRYNERVRIRGQDCTDDQLCRAFERIERSRDDVPLTYFEFGTLAALDVFLDADTDVAILEVGLGGRLDVVNLFDADVAIVSTVGIDHVDWLGPDRESIGREKAGIFRPGRPAICGEPDPPKSLVAEAERIGARFLQLGRDFDFSCDDGACTWHGPEQVRSALPHPALGGLHQLRNAACVLMAVAELSSQLPVDQAAIRSGLPGVRLPGRLQSLPGTPQVILDVAHNPQAVAVLAQRLAAGVSPGHTHAVVGMMQDKDIAGCLRQIAPQVDRWYLATLPSARGVSSTRLRQVLEECDPGAVARRFDTVPEAFDFARSCASPADRIVVFGSFETVGAIMRHSSGT